MLKKCQNNTHFYKFLKHAVLNTQFLGKHSYEAKWFLKDKRMIDIKFRIAVTSEGKKGEDTVLGRKTQNTAVQAGFVFFSHGVLWFFKLSICYAFYSFVFMI